MLLTSIASIVLVWSRFMRRTRKMKPSAMAHSTAEMAAITILSEPDPNRSDFSFSPANATAPSVGIANPVSASLFSCVDDVPAMTYVMVVNAPTTVSIAIHLAPEQRVEV